MVGVTFCVVEFSYFGLCNVLCREGLQSNLLRPAWGTSLGEDKLGARDKILNTKVARRANIPLCRAHVGYQKLRLSPGQPVARS